MRFDSPLHYQVETLPHGGIAIWRTSNDNKKVYSVTEIMPQEILPPKPKPKPPNLDDQLTALLQAMSEM